MAGDDALRRLLREHGADAVADQLDRGVTTNAAAFVRLRRDLTRVVTEVTAAGGRPQLRAAIEGCLSAGGPPARAIGALLGNDLR